ncbi:complement C1q tumor necrosis factor-related protein 3-like [Dreissena polymorpha]|uniref:C1q domain-containing protein n=1 Tax=Dreissena polymorpha TaxID=45954 RepID=A0A9D4G8F9_DREPO|nr:complement C1q tumor necrosis factor-related protein 3-like [Dreissena polymorpha]KAH3810658.1 hypothetical protein DPMN_139053 [Dreissena polymorpha]
MVFRFLVGCALISILHRNYVQSDDFNLQARIDQLEKKIEFEKESTLQTCKKMNAQLQEEVLSLRTIITNVQQNGTLTNKRQSPPELVAFTAYIENGAGHISNGQIIPFDRTVTNLGNAFNIHSHTFVCPVDGLYMFSFVVSHYGRGEVLGKLVIDGVNIVDAIANPVADDHDQQGVNMAVVQARRGQAVQVVNYLYNDAWYRTDEINRFSTFSGVLLQAT